MSYKTTNPKNARYAPTSGLPSSVISTEGSTPGPRNMAANLVALGRGPQKGPEAKDDLRLRPSRSASGSTEPIFYLDGRSTGLRKSEGELAETLNARFGGS
jgi:hypothetical protein